MKITLFSFGFKHGHPDADLVLDVRFLINPYWEPDLRDHSGLEKEVASYVLDNSSGQDFLQHLRTFLIFYLNRHQQADRKEISCAIGCTGGRHRSVAVTEYLAELLTGKGFSVQKYHRDIQKD
jgi:UPF0042 nucleotide-binding protein